MDETPKGWFITYIDRDSETLFKEKMKNKRIQLDMSEEEKKEREIQKQIEKAEQLMSSNSDGNKENAAEDAVVKELNLEDGVKIGFSLGSTVAKKEKGETSKPKPRVVFEEADNEEKKPRNQSTKDNVVGKKRAWEELMKEEENLKEKSNRKDYWLFEGIVVKVMSKALAEKGYYRQKGVIKRVIDKYVGEIEMLESKHVLRVDQEELETVIPQIGGLVKIVNGAYRGSNARLLSVDTEKFCAKVQIEKGIYDGRVLKAVEYEDLCKVA